MLRPQQQRRGSHLFPRKKRDSWMEKSPVELYRLAIDFWKKRDYAQAIPALQQVANQYSEKEAATAVKVSVTSSWMDLFYCYHYMAHSLLQQGDYAEAIVVCMQGIVIAQTEDNDIFILSSTYQNLGHAYLAIEQFSQAKQAFHTAIEIRSRGGYRCRQNQNNDSSLSVATSYQGLGDTHRIMGEYNLAIPCYQKAMVIREMKANIDSLLLAETYGSMAVTFCEMGDMQQADDYIRKALSIVDTTTVDDVDDDDPLSNGIVGRVLLQAGIIQRETSNLTVAKQTFERALPILQRRNHHSMNESIPVANCLREMAYTQMLMKDLSNDTWTKIEQALQTLNTIAPTSVAMAVTKRTQGEWYRMNHLCDQAKTCLHSARDIFVAQNEPVCSFEVTMTLEALALVSESTGDCRQALFYYKEARSVYQKQPDTIRNRAAAATTLRSIDRLATKIASESSNVLVRHGRHHSDLPVPTVQIATAFPTVSTTTNAQNNKNNRARSASCNDFASAGNRCIPSSAVPMRIPTNDRTNANRCREGSVHATQFLPEYKHQCQEVLFADRENGHDDTRSNSDRNGTWQSPQDDARADTRSTDNHATPLLDSFRSKVDHLADPLWNRTSSNTASDVSHGHDGGPIRALNFVVDYKHQCQDVAFVSEADGRNDFVAAPNCYVNRQFFQKATTESKAQENHALSSCAKRANSSTDPLTNRPASSSNVGANAFCGSEESGVLTPLTEFNHHQNRPFVRASEVADGKSCAMALNSVRNRDDGTDHIRLVRNGVDATIQPEVSFNGQNGEVAGTDNRTVTNFELNGDGMKSGRFATSAATFRVPDVVGHEPSETKDHNVDDSLLLTHRGTQVDLTVSELTVDSVARFETDDDVVPIVQEVVTVQVPTHNQDINKPILLYVDDEPLNVPQAIDMLKRHFRIIQTSSTASALHLLDELRTEPRVVVSDMGRRESSAGFNSYVADAGLLLIDVIRSSGRNMPIIIFSTSDNVERYRGRVLQVGGTDIVGSNQDLYDLVLRISANPESHGNPQDSVIAHVSNYS